ncbi:hypothetical protein H257_09556 [Aphanomyces astaci]|uniref:SAM domain-containing protein n=1 Tax=Aphanomyces astaci TaxID=112090 RepID=W4GBC0_APHAT|nr:hypothetical protein H257_09556 [Aphanomyces astaci]ETV76556.1 hypothetical protein H257_09556 [Aphanomyces astaci]|eukprot:XP_009834101.1 hypothetical protein H257_09556 [Aphanomyces astaci]
MGAGTLSKPSGSTTAEATIDTITNYSAQEIATIVIGFGAAYEPYGAKIVDNGIDGQLMGELGIDEVSSIVQTLGVTNAIHVKKIALFFKSFKEKQLGITLASPPVDSPAISAASPARSTGSRKIRRTSIGHSVEKQQTSEDVLASLRASLATDNKEVSPDPIAVGAAVPSAATPPAQPTTTSSSPLPEPAAQATTELSSSQPLVSPTAAP